MSFGWKNKQIKKHCSVTVNVTLTSWPNIFFIKINWKIDMQSKLYWLENEMWKGKRKEGGNVNLNFEHWTSHQIQLELISHLCKK